MTTRLRPTHPSACEEGEADHEQDGRDDEEAAEVDHCANKPQDPKQRERAGEPANVIASDGRVMWAAAQVRGAIA